MIVRYSSRLGPSSNPFRSWPTVMLCGSGSYTLYPGPAFVTFPTTSNLDTRSGCIYDDDANEGRHDCMIEREKKIPGSEDFGQFRCSAFCAATGVENQYIAAFEW